MKKSLSLSSLLLLIMLLLASSSVYAAKIYKWVDSEGNVHYGERPPAGQGEQVRVPRPSTHSSAPAKEAEGEDKPNDSSKFLDNTEAEQKEKQEAAQKAAEDQKVKAENCSRAKRYAASLRQGGRQYEVDEQGNRSYLGDEDIQKRLSEAEEMVNKWCN